MKIRVMEIHNKLRVCIKKEINFMSREISSKLRNDTEKLSN
jgi:hypothetical protein